MNKTNPGESEKKENNKQPSEDNPINPREDFPPKQK